MKKLILSLVSALLFNIPSMAQWSDDTNVSYKITPEGREDASCVSETNKNGVTYVYIEDPVAAGQLDKKLQIIDKDGKKLFPEEGLLISNEKTMSYTTGGQSIFIDDEGNAVFAVNDQRTGGYSYTLYKYNEKGEKLWGGVQMNDAKPLKRIARMSICQTSDGSYIAAFMGNFKSNFAKDPYIQVEKISRDGKKLWKEPLKIGAADGEEKADFPFVVNAGNNQCIIVYAKGDTQKLVARMIDFDGASAWEDEVVVNATGGWANMPLNLQYGVKEGPEGGVIVTWRGPSENGTYENRISYIKNDGTYGFSTGIEGTVVSHDDNYSRMQPEFYVDEKDNAIYCLYGEFDQAHQNYNGIFMQKISLDGELLWGPTGKTIVEIQTENYAAYGNILKIDDNTFAVLYQEKSNETEFSATGSYIILYDKDGNALNEKFNFTTTDTHKMCLRTSELINGKYLFTRWDTMENNEPVAETRRWITNTYMYRLNIENIKTGITDIKCDDNNGEVKSIEIFSATGERLNNYVNGVNVVRTTYENGKTFVNKIIK